MAEHKKPTSRLRWYAVAASCTAIAVASMAVYLRCFREVRHDNPELGTVSERFSFCRLREIACDANRDGVVDARVLVSSRDDVLGGTSEITEGWESIDLDGVMNLHYYYEGQERVLVLEIDMNKDGMFEKKLAGSEAVERFRVLRRVGPEGLLGGATIGGVRQVCREGPLVQQVQVLPRKNRPRRPSRRREHRGLA